MADNTATIRQIAQAAGVSPCTAYRALNKEELVSPATRAKVLAAKRLLENKDERKPEAPVKSSASVGIIMPVSTAHDIGRHPSMFVAMSSFVAGLTAAHVSNTVLVFDENTMRAEDLVGAHMDGYMITGTSLRQEELLIPAISGAGIPCVLINRLSDLPHTGSVNIDDKAAVRKTTEHLIAQGHRRIVFLAGPRNYQHTVRRQQGFLAAMNDAGLPVGEESVLYGDYSESSGFEMAASVLKMQPRPTAAVCASDTIALGCIHRMIGNGLSVPEDFSVIGFGDVESGRTCVPPLSTVSQCSMEVGEIASQMILQMMSSPIIEKQRITLQTKLIVRGTTAPPKTEA